MERPDEDAVKALVEFKSGDLAEHRAFEVLSDVRAENTWLANFQSANTRDAYQRSVASFVATIGITSADELYQVKQAHVLAWRTSMQAAGLSQASIAARLSALSSLYKQLTDQQLTPSNPVAGVKRPKTGNAGIGAGKSPTLSQSQVRAMLDAPDTSKLQGLRDRALMHIFFFVGARVSEPTHLRVKDFGYDAEFPKLDMTIKGGKLNTVVINLECAQAIREYLDAAPHGQEPDAYIFRQAKVGKLGQRPGRAMSRRQMYNLFKRCGKVAGVNVDTALFTHMARATMITTAYDAKVPGEHIQRTVGHSSITTTEGYNHTATKHRESASLKISY